MFYSPSIGKLYETRLSERQAPLHLDHRKCALLVVLVLAAPAPVAIAAGHRKPVPPKPNIALGEALFAGWCSSCHTFKAAAATATIGPNLDKYPPPSLAYAKYQITHGDGPMPAFTRFTPQQVADIAAFVWKKRQK